jgi:chitodextrinase
MKKTFLAIAVAMTISGSVWAAELYDPGKTYNGGEQVSFNGDVYQAKWWVGTGDSPAGINPDAPWDSPWELVSEGTGETAPPPPPTGGDDGENPEVPEQPDPELDNYDQYVAGDKYESGNVVRNGNKLYRCKPGVSAWCSGAAWAYEPGKGSAWQQAWEVVTSGDITNPGDGNGNGGTGGTGGDNGNGGTGGDNGNGGTGGDNGNGGTGGNGYTITRDQLNKKEAELTDFPAMKIVKDTIRTLDNEAVEAIAPGNPTNPENVQRIESIVSEHDFNYMFAKRAPEYDYVKFLKATGKFPAFCGTYTDGRDSDDICRRALATMFAHFTQETGGHTSWWEVPEWRQGLVHVREMGWDENMRGGYNGECNPDVWQGQTWPCGTFENGEFKSYFGRGAKQLSYNYNYGPFSYAMFGTVRTLLDDPALVADTWLNLASAVFFFIYPQPPKPSMLHVIDGTWQPNDRDISNGLVPGFGVTTQIINGGVECGGSVEVAQSLNRISYFKSFSTHLGVNVPEDEVLGCKGMKSFDEDGAGAVNIYWEKDWGWSADTPSGDTYSCQLVGYQTPFSAFTEGDYEKCVKKNFPDVNIVD